MAIKRFTKRRPKASRPVRAGDLTMSFVVDERQASNDGVVLPSMEEIEAALSQVPEHLGWDWASQRLIPLFERGYGEGVTGDPMINTISPLGIGIGFGIDFGPVLGRVTTSMARQWEASVEQIERAAYAHLAEAVAAVSAAAVQSVVDHGHLYRALGEPGGWASSVVLAGGDELSRIFRVRSSFFTVPSRNTLLAFGPGTPSRVVAEITVMHERLDPHPLEMDPFAMEDGVVRWEGLDDEAIEVI